MKLDQNWLLYGGLAIAGIFVVMLMSSPTMMEDFKYGISKLFNPNTPLPPDVAALTSGDEVEQTAMYAGYY